MARPTPRKEYNTDGELRCNRCGKFFPANSNYFTRHKACRGGITARCLGCYNIWRIQYELEHRAYITQYAKTYRKAHREQYKVYFKRKTWKLKLEVLAGYGGKCVCCGETEPKFLTIDHIHNDGAEERRKDPKSQGPTFYRKLKLLGFPRDKYQVLCFNCNCAKGFFGICPHEKRKGELK